MLVEQLSSQQLTLYVQTYVAEIHCKFKKHDIMFQAIDNDWSNAITAAKTDRRTEEKGEHTVLFFQMRAATQELNFSKQKQCFLIGCKLNTHVHIPYYLC